MLDSSTAPSLADLRLERARAEAALSRRRAAHRLIVSVATTPEMIAWEQQRRDYLAALEESVARLAAAAARCESAVLRLEQPPAAAPTPEGGQPG